jgi:uncharacterized protein YdaT
MPWTGKTFAAKHNHSLSGKAASKAADIASAIVRRGGDEGVAIATANKYANKLRSRGVVSNKAHARMKHPELRGRISNG